MGCGHSENNRKQIAYYRNLSDVRNQKNVNMNYSNIIKIDVGLTINDGLRKVYKQSSKTYSYHSLVGFQQLLQEREKFWNKKIIQDPNSSKWTIIKNAIEAQSDKKSRKILETVNIVPFEDNIQLCIDQDKNIYQVPVFLINEPQSYNEKLNAQDQTQHQQQKALKSLNLKLRSMSSGIPDFQFSACPQDTIGSIKANILSKNSFEKKTSGIRLFYSGKQLNNKQPLSYYNIEEGNIIQALLK